MKENSTIDFAPNSIEKQGESFINKKIGNTLYRVSVRFSDTSKESMDDKIIRLAKHDAENMREAVGQ